MPEIPKEKPEREKDTDPEHDDASWGEDQQKRGYYYDDSHGYEVYKPDKDDRDKDENED